MTRQKAKKQERKQEHESDKKQSTPPPPTDSERKALLEELCVSLKKSSFYQYCENQRAREALDEGFKGKSDDTRGETNCQFDLDRKPTALDYKMAKKSIERRSMIYATRIALLKRPFPSELLRGAALEANAAQLLSEIYDPRMLERFHYIMKAEETRPSTHMSPVEIADLKRDFEETMKFATLFSKELNLQKKEDERPNGENGEGEEAPGEDVLEGGSNTDSEVVGEEEKEEEEIEDESDVDDESDETEEPPEETKTSVMEKIFLSPFTNPSSEMLEAFIKTSEQLISFRKTCSNNQHQLGVSTEDGESTCSCQSLTNLLERMQKNHNITSLVLFRHMNNKFQETFNQPAADSDQSSSEKTNDSDVE